MTQLELTSFPIATKKVKRQIQSNSQRQRILEMLLDHPIVLSAELRLFAYQYNARIYELRKGMHDGLEYNIISLRDEKGRSGYKLEV